MNSQVLPAIKECIEYIEQENDEISLSDESLSPFVIDKIVAELDDNYWDNDLRPNSWRVTAYNKRGEKYKYAWYISESGMITADGS